jgi:hypothetical protein
MDSQHDINLALEFSIDHGQSLLERFRNLKPKEEGLNIVRVWRRWERNVSQFLSPQEREIFLSFQSTPGFSVMGLRLEVANCIEKQVTFLRELNSSDTADSMTRSTPEEPRVTTRLNLEGGPKPEGQK